MQDYRQTIELRALSLQFCNSGHRQDSVRTIRLKVTGHRNSGPEGDLQSTALIFR